MKAVVIGAGLGGLECGWMLAKEGVEVTVLEQLPRVGGCMQSYQRGGMSFDTGFHYVGGLDEGEHLWRIFDHLGLTELPWKALDREGFDHVIVGGKEYAIPCGHEAFEKRMQDYFPQHKEAITQFTTLLKLVGDTIFSHNGLKEQLMGMSAYNYLHTLFEGDEEIIQVLSGAATKMDLEAGRLPLYTYAQITDSFLRGAYRLKGPGDQMARRLADNIVTMGGQVVCGAKVDRIRVEGNHVVLVEATTQEGALLPVEHPDWVISSINPLATFDMMEGDYKLRGIYRRRIEQMPMSKGIFTASLVLRGERHPYRNYNVFIHPDGDVWQRDGREATDVMVHYAVPTAADAPTQIDLMTPMSWEKVAPWNFGSEVQTGEIYVDMKQRWLKDVLTIAERYLPHLEEDIAQAYTSTPLTYHRYTGVAHGAAFGLERSWVQGFNSVISPRTPLDNLMLTGQNLMLHGVLGVSMTATDTVQRVLGKEINF